MTQPPLLPVPPMPLQWPMPSMPAQPALPKMPKQPAQPKIFPEMPARIPGDPGASLGT